MKGKKKFGKKWIKPEITVLSPDATASMGKMAPAEGMKKFPQKTVYYYS